MSLQKLTITPDGLPDIKVQFNPASYSITKSVTWGGTTTEASEAGKKCAGTNKKLNAPTKHFGGGGSRTLTFDLFFDVTEPVNGEQVKDVRVKTNELVKLTRIERTGENKGKPPVCTISWGGSDGSGISDLPFRGVITNLTQKFTLFDGQGNPLRAELGVTFTEFINPTKDQKETDPEFTTHIVRRGDTLSSIAAKMYSKPVLWRVIANANNVDDPRGIEIGRALHIPKVG